MAIFLIGGFVILTIVLVLWLGICLAWTAMTAELANTFSICGVSATVATSPAMEAEASDVAYATATILGFGIVTMFIGSSRNRVGILMGEVA